jgi:hypothetical protein
MLERREIGSQVSKLTAKGSEVKMFPEQESGVDLVKGAKTGKLLLVLPRMICL